MVSFHSALSGSITAWLPRGDEIFDAG